MGYLELKKEDFRSQILKTALKNSNVEQLSILKCDLFKNKNGLEWLENNKEILIEGNYYEVLKLEEKENIIIISLINDKKENKLFSVFFEKNFYHNHLLELILKLHSGLNQANTFAYNCEDLVCDVKINFYFFNSFKLKKYNSKVIKPPTGI